MRRATVGGGGGGAHSVVDAAVCHGCKHPVRLHNPVGCVRGECECSLTRDDLTAPAAAAHEPPQAAEPPSPTSIDRLNPPCARCTHRRGFHAVSGTGLPCRACSCRQFTTEEVPDAAASTGDVPELASAAAGPASSGSAEPAAAAAGAGSGDGRSAVAPAVKTPRRRQTPRPAARAVPVDAAVVGEAGDADEEVAAADPVATGAAVTALDSLAAFVEQLFETAYFVAPRWYCPSCRDWPLDPGACRVCKAPLQPVYLATVPRKVTP